MIASAVPLAILGNLFRMLTIVIAAEMGGQEVGNKVHESTILGIIPYIPAILGLFTLGHFLEGKQKKSTRPESEKPESSRDNQTPGTVALAKEAQI